MSRSKPRAKAALTDGPRRDWNWIQTQRAAFGPLADLVLTQPAAARLLLLVVQNLEQHTGGVVVASRTTLCELTGYSLPTVQRAIKHLVEHQWVQRVKIGSAYALAVNSNIAWIGARKQLNHAVFTATVIASRREQERQDLEAVPPKMIPLAVTVTQFENTPHDPLPDMLRALGDAAQTHYFKGQPPGNEFENEEEGNDDAPAS